MSRSRRKHNYVGKSVDRTYKRLFNKQLRKLSNEEINDGGSYKLYPQKFYWTYKSKIENWYKITNELVLFGGTKLVFKTLVDNSKYLRK